MTDISSFRAQKKVLFVITKSNWGGAQRYVFDVATNLPEEFEPAVALGGTGVAGAGEGALAQKLREQNIRTIFVESFMRDIAPRKELGALRELIAIFKTERPDIVHLNSSKAGGLGALAARLAGVKKIVFTSHGLAWDEDRPWHARAFIWLATWATFMLCHEAIVLSKDTYQRATWLPFCKRKVHLVYNGLRELEFMSAADARAALGERLSMSGDADTMWVGTLGELVRNKGLEYLIGAAELLRRREINFVICIAGEGDERPALERMIREKGLEQCVYLAGFLTEGYRYMQAFDIYALPSVKEGLPYVLLEAGQASRAVVASRIPGNVDVLSDAVSGLLCEPKNKEQLATKLELLIKNADMRARLGAALNAKVERDFSLKKMEADIVALYLS